VTVIRRGEVIATGRTVSAKAGSGQFLPRKAGFAAVPRGTPSPEFDPARNFGAKL
jgi:dihydropyrimidinase